MVLAGTTTQDDGQLPHELYWIPSRSPEQKTWKLQLEVLLFFFVHSDGPRAAADSRFTYACEDCSYIMRASRCWRGEVMSAVTSFGCFLRSAVSSTPLTSPPGCPPWPVTPFHQSMNLDVDLTPESASREPTGPRRYQQKEVQWRDTAREDAGKQEIQKPGVCIAQPEIGALNVDGRKTNNNHLLIFLFVKPAKPSERKTKITAEELTLTADVQRTIAEWSWAWDKFPRPRLTALKHGAEEWLSGGLQPRRLCQNQSEEKKNSRITQFCERSRVTAHWSAQPKPHSPRSAATNINSGPENNEKRVKWNARNLDDLCVYKNADEDQRNFKPNCGCSWQLLSLSIKGAMRKRLVTCWIHTPNTLEAINDQRNANCC